MDDGLITRSHLHQITAHQGDGLRDTRRCGPVGFGPFGNQDVPRRRDSPVDCQRIECVSVVAKINDNIACRGRHRPAKRQRIVAIAQHQVDVFCRDIACMGHIIDATAGQEPEIATAGEGARQGDGIPLTCARGDAGIARNRRQGARDSHVAAQTIQIAMIGIDDQVRGRANDRRRRNHQVVTGVQGDAAFGRGQRLAGIHSNIVAVVRTAFCRGVNDIPDDRDIGCHSDRTARRYDRIATGIHAKRIFRLDNCPNR